MIGGLKQSVLIVDDQENWRNLVREILENKFEVAVAESYAEALNVISKKVAPFHVLVTDMRLKDAQHGNEDGLQLIEYLNSMGSETRTIIITGYPTIATIQRAVFGLQVSYYFEKSPSNGKPFDSAGFLEIVQRVAMEAESNRNRLVFVLMPFAEEYRDFYEDAIKRIIVELGLDCRRVDDFFGPHSIMADVSKYIKDAKFVLADFSGRNPNVFFEVGISHAIGKTVLLLTQDLKDVPPKLQTIRCHEYKSSLAGAARIKIVLENAIKEIQKANYPAFFDSVKFGLLPRSCIALMPGNTAGRRTYDDLVLPALHEAKCTAARSDEIFNFNSILDEIWARINSAEVIIADLSGRDADVFYLAGLAYGLGKKIIYLARDEADVPFDFRAGSLLIYSLDPFAEGFRAQRKLAQLVTDILGQPISDFSL